MRPKHKKVRQAVAFDEAERRPHASLGTPELTPDQLLQLPLLLSCTAIYRLPSLFLTRNQESLIFHTSQWYATSNML
jgi:hypothetical protein